MVIPTWWSALRACSRKVIVAVAVNPGKGTAFPIETRVTLAREVLAHVDECRGVQLR